MRRSTLWFLLVLACSDQVRPVEEQTVQEDERYAFCHFPESEEPVERWCELAEELPAGECEGLRSRCRGEVPPPGGCSSEPDAPPSATQPEDVPPETLPETAFSSIAQWIAASLVALVVLVFFGMALLLAFRSLRSRQRRAPPLEPTMVAESAPEDSVAEAIPVAPSGQLLVRAQEALGAGHFGDAVVLCRGAVLRALADAEVVEIHPSRTDREYARATRGRPVHADVRAVVGERERVRWGLRPASRQDAERVLEAARRVLGALALVLLVVLGRGEAAVAASPGAPAFHVDGYAALIGRLDAEGFDVSIRVRPLLDVSRSEVDVLVVDDWRMERSEAEWSAVRGWVESGGVLVLGAPIPSAFPELGVARMVSADGLQASTRWAGPLPVWPEESVRGFFQGSRNREIWIAARADEEPIAEVGVVVGVSVGAGGVLAIAGFDPLRNGGMMVEANRPLIPHGLDLGDRRGLWSSRVGDRIEVVLAPGVTADSAPEGGGGSPLSSLIGAQLLPFLLQAMLLMAIAAWWLGRRFGRPDSGDEGEGKAFSEHVVALGQRHARARQTGRSEMYVARIWLERLGENGLEAAARRQGHPDPSGFVTRVRSAAEETSGSVPSDRSVLEELWMVLAKKP